MAMTILPRRTSTFFGRRRSSLLFLVLGSSRRCITTTTALKSVVPVWFDSSNHLHYDIQYHPEQPERITACVKALSRESCVKLMDVADSPISLLSTPSDDSDDSSSSTQNSKIDSTPFSTSALQHAREILLQTHDPELVTGLEKKCQLGRERRLAEGQDAVGHLGHIDLDTYVTTETWNIILRATATWIRAVDEALAAATKPTMALTRPPGHHATRGESNGFCLVNFAPAAALHALSSQPAVQRVSILDWDVHYGQGVADIVRHHIQSRYGMSRCIRFQPFPTWENPKESKGVVMS